MKKLMGLISILIFYSFISYAQNENLEQAKLIRISDGDSITWFIKKFEIDVDKKKVYSVNPVTNYLDIKGGKYRTQIKMDKKKWRKIMNLLWKIDLSNYELIENESRNYSITFLFKDNSSKIYTTQNENSLNNLKEIIEILRDI